MDKDNTIIEIVNFTKSFKDKTVLQNINLSIKKGKCYGIVGRNGSGKTLIFKAICGFIKATSGYIKVNGLKIGSDIDYPDNVGVLIEQPGFLGNYSAFENLKFLASINNIINEDEIKKVLSFVNLDPVDNKAVKKYSVGMKQRLGIAQAIMENPEILILDEPFNGLDKKGVREITDLLIQQKKIGKTILLTSHDERTIDELCDRVIEIEKGRILCAGKH